LCFGTGGREEGHQLVCFLSRETIVHRPREDRHELHDVLALRLGVFGAGGNALPLADGVDNRRLDGVRGGEEVDGEASGTADGAQRYVRALRRLKTLLEEVTGIGAWPPGGSHSKPAKE
jgi:hypothetical protein